MHEFRKKLDENKKRGKKIKRYRSSFDGLIIAEN